MKHKFAYIVVTVICVLVCGACASKSKIPLSNFQQMQTVPRFNGTYLNLKGDIGQSLKLRSSGGDYWYSSETDLIHLEYDGRDSLRISFQTEDGLQQKAYKAKKVENCIEIVPERKRLYIPAAFIDSRFRLRFGSDADNDLLLHVKEDHAAWVFIIFGGHESDFDKRYNKIENMCKDTTLLIPTLVDGKWGYTDCQGQTVIAPTYDFARLFDSNGIARVKKDGLWGTITMDATQVAPYKYTKIDTYDSKMDGYRIHIGEDYGYMRIDGKEYVPPKYSSVPYHYSYDTPYSIKCNGKIGFIDSTGIMCPAILDKLNSDGWWQPNRPTDSSYGKMKKVTYKGQKYYLSLDGFLYPYEYKFFKENTTLFYEQRIDTKDIPEED